MTVQRMEHVGIVVENLAVATGFVHQLGLKLLGEGSLEGHPEHAETCPAGRSADTLHEQTGSTRERAGIPWIEMQDDGRHETRDERLDRNTAEMVQELRVGSVGIQVLFGFLLVVPFNVGWKHTTTFEHRVYYVTLICIAFATVLLIAPSVHHRLLFREGESRS
jgi:Family of unknown function (DUF6328)